MLDTLGIAWLCVFIIDYSGIIQSVEGMIAKAIGFPSVRIPKPFSCSLCSTWWSGLAYLIWTHNISIPHICWVGFCAAITPEINAAIWTFKDIAQIVLRKIKPKR